MPRFFKEDFKTAPYIEGEDFTHISRSLRMRVGERLVVCDKKGTEFDCVIDEITLDRVLLKVLEERKSESEPDISVTLCTCLLKGDKFEQVIKHSTELGVSEILPVVSENCVSRPDEKALKGKIPRWQKIALEAAGQSGRGKIPTVQNAISLKSLAQRLSEFDLALFFYEAGGEPLGETLWENQGSRKIAVITGPEGGFSNEEAKLLESLGAKTITLGKRILRAETAPLAALTGIMLLTDNLE